MSVAIENESENSNANDEEIIVITEEEEEEGEGGRGQSGRLSMRVESVTESEGTHSAGGGDILCVEKKDDSSANAHRKYVTTRDGTSVLFQNLPLSPSSSLSPASSPSPSPSPYPSVDPFDQFSFDVKYLKTVVSHGSSIKICVTIHGTDDAFDTLKGKVESCFLRRI